MPNQLGINDGFEDGLGQEALHGFYNLLSFSTEETYYSTKVYTSAMLFEIFLFGLYVALFGTCLYVFTRNRNSLQKGIFLATLSMFCFATADVIWGILNMNAFILQKKKIPIKALQYKFLLYITSNIVADLVLLYRCYILWNNSVRIIVVPCLVLLGGTICGYLFVGMSDDEYPFRFLLSIFLFSTLALNVIVTTLISGRIWWITRRRRTVLSPKLTKKYRTAITVFIESGLIYSIYVLLDVLLHELLLDAGLVQIVGLVPTLMIVQIGLSRKSHKQGTRAGSISDSETGGFTNTDFLCDTRTLPTSLPIPVPSYRVERYRVGYSSSPSSDETRTEIAR